MTDPIVFVSHFRIKEGRFQDLRRHFLEAARALEMEKPQTSAFLPYGDDRGGALSIVHLFANADAMDAHVQGAEERSQAAYQFMDPGGWEIYGKPSASVMRMLQQAATGSRVDLKVRPIPFEGFLRLRSP
jgi:hypothetical protein